MNKLKFGLGLFGLGLFGLFGVKVNAEEVVPEDEPTIEEVVGEETSTYNAQIIIECGKYGDVTSDLEQGNAGDIVKLNVKPFALCKIVKVSVNDNELTADENGNYSFVLNEGNNKVSAEFDIDQAQVKAIISTIDNVKENGLSSLFTMKNLLLLMYLLGSILIATRGLRTLVKCKTIEANTKLNTTNAATKAIDDALGEKLQTWMNGVVMPIFNQFNVKTDTIDKVMRCMTKCLILAQEGSESARLQILDELMNLQTSDDELTNQVRAMINEEIAKNEASKQAKIDAIEALEKANNEILVKEEVVEEIKEEDYGKF